MTRITEKRDVQDQLINCLSGIGWTFIPQNELPAWRDHDEHEPFLIETLRAQLAALNSRQCRRHLHRRPTCLCSR